MSLEIVGAVPYEYGDHCVFYAVQEANIHFNRMPLTLEDREAFQEERTKRVKLYKAVTGLTEEKGGWLKISLQMLMSKLKEHDIVSDSFLCTEETKRILEGLNFINRENVQLIASEGSAVIEFPVVFLVERFEAGENHAWFAASSDDYYEKYSMHMSEGDKIVLVAHLIKQE